MRLVFASNNAHKLQEVRQILPATCEVLSLRDIGCTDEIEETGETLEENSLIKAQYIYDKYGVDCFADDTGLEIEALNGKPGVRTARWAGEDANAVNNRQKALRELEGITHRDAQFRTVVTLIRGGKVQQVEGVVRGRIATKQRGEGGFGYDPIFIPEGYELTFAELPPEVKNTISHRARAMAELNKIIR
ncbi:MAG: RdgB/HAM1 family non-canonical purine NTP pyrophosphatase [Paludibacteraceae bacterium]|nr:RdgB/HAM1 family non-canonical purine NTP pyrophosphatase [Paludibacteraceae bacterium]